MAIPNIAAATAKMYKKSATPACVTAVGTIIQNAAGSGFSLEITEATFASLSASIAGIVDLNLVKSAGTATKIIGTATDVPVKGTVIAIDKNSPITLEEGDCITGSATNAALSLSYNQYQES